MIDEKQNLYVLNGICLQPIKTMCCRSVCTFFFFKLAMQIIYHPYFLPGGIV